MPFPLVPVAVVGAAGAGALYLAKHHHPAAQKAAATQAAASKLGASSSSAPPFNTIAKALDAAGLSDVATYAKVLDTASKIETLGVAASGGNAAQQDTQRVAGFLGGGGGTLGAGGIGTAVAIGLTSRNVADKGLAALGVTDNKTRNTLAQSIGTAAAFGSYAGPSGVVAATAVELAAQGGSALIGAVWGSKAEQDVRNKVKQFDPTASGTPAAKFVGKLSSAIGSVFGTKGAQGVSFGKISIPKVNVSLPKVNISLPKISISTPKHHTWIHF